MLRKTSVKKYWHWAGLALLSALIAVTALIAPSRVSQLELEREALVAQDRIQAQLVKDPNVVLEALTRPGFAPQLDQVFQQAGYAHRVLRFELYDARGRLTFTSGLASLPLDDSLVDVKTNPAQEGAVIGLYTSNVDGAPSHFAVLRLPLDFNHLTRGSLVVYLDQSDQANVLSGYFSLIAAVTLLLLGVGIATPVAFAWMRSQERRQAVEQVRYLESHDALTGLANRRAFAEGLAEAMSRTLREGTHIAVVCLDIDKFREINDATEHGGGDQVLREMGLRIKGTLRDRDLIARLGADEFAIALVDITNLGDVMAFMNRLVAALRDPFHVAGKDLLITTSVGIALAPADGDTAATVLRHATIALSRVKGDGGQRMCFFEESMDKALQRRRTVEHELRLALGREEFEVVYQPQYDLTSERQCGSEALIRWHHPVHGKIAPGHFISVAEETGLIVPIGEWVLRRACRDAATWPEGLTVAVNLSPAQFRDGDIAETVAEVLKETGLPPERLELEITENLLINDTEEVLGKLNRLRELGVAIAMDDFGTGYSSLSYLARFPFSKIKIDRQFIRNMTRDPAMRAIVKTIIALGKSLDVIITAEGVETPEQAEMLRKFGCPQVQGFLYGYPEGAEESAKPKGKPKDTAQSKVTPIRTRSSAA
ncbi:MAG: putative bifunctional diguanylate cyclase/phosphodiesterase [Methyloceanibacter sp.]|uniref:putative bifunctional diguanylate cyclase/phosphodiesterase n=1 Tax=Methyloceanibacter sp. TaxID=1965321 RepID=UPI003D6D0752